MVKVSKLLGRKRDHKWAMIIKDFICTYWLNSSIKNSISPCNSIELRPWTVEQAQTTGKDWVSSPQKHSSNRIEINFHTTWSKCYVISCLTVQTEAIHSIIIMMFSRSLNVILSWLNLNRKNPPKGLFLVCFILVSQKFKKSSWNILHFGVTAPGDFYYSIFNTDT